MATLSPKVSSSKESDKGGSTDTFHTDDVIPVKPIKDYWYVLLLSLLIAFGGFMFGYDMGAIASYVGMPDFLERFGIQSKSDPSVRYFTNARVGLMVAILSIGGIVGGLTLAKVADRYGRKKAIGIASMIYMLAILIQITAQESWVQIVIGRLVQGFGIGSISITSPMLISESAPSQIRGICVFFYQFMATVGTFTGYCINYGTHTLHGSKLWRIPLGMCLVWGFILLSGSIIVPESPRFLASEGKNDEALQSLAKLSRTTVDNPELKMELDEIIAGIELERSEGSVPWNEIFVGKPRIFYRMMIGVLIQTAQQLTGANYFFYYGTIIFKAVGLQDSYLTSIILGAVNLGTSPIGLIFIDRFGRRVVCLVGASGMFVCFIIYSSLGSQNLYLEDGTSSVPVGNAMIFLTCLFIAFFASTWGGISNVITSELFPGRVRSIGMSISISNLWLWSFLTNFFTPFISSAINFYYGYVYTGCLLGTMVFVYFFVYETKGLTLEEADEMFASDVKAWNSPSWRPAHKTIKELETA